MTVNICRTALALVFLAGCVTARPVPDGPAEPAAYLDARVSITGEGKVDSFWHGGRVIAYPKSTGPWAVTVTWYNQTDMPLRFFWHCNWNDEIFDPHHDFWQETVLPQRGKESFEFSVRDNNHGGIVCETR